MSVSITLYISGADSLFGDFPFLSIIIWFLIRIWRISLFDLILEFLSDNRIPFKENEIPDRSIVRNFNGGNRGPLSVVFSDLDGLLNIGDKIVSILDAYRQTDEVR